MGPDGRRKKKLIIAFHFLSGSQAGWECGACRRGGLEERRGCGFAGFGAAPRPVWVRGKAVAYQCPRTLITGASVAFVEEFHAWKLAGMPDLRAYPARAADALMILEQEVRAEQRHE